MGCGCSGSQQAGQGSGSQQEQVGVASADYYWNGPKKVADKQEIAPAPVTPAP